MTSTARARQLLEQLERDRQRALDLLQRLVATESPSRHPHLLVNVQKLLVEEFEDLDYRVRHIPSDLTGGIFWRYRGSANVVGRCR